MAQKQKAKNTAKTAKAVKPITTAKASAKTGKGSVKTTSAFAETRGSTSKLPKKAISRGISVKKSTLVRIGIIALIVIIGIPLLDLIIQVSITSRYAAIVGMNSVPRSAYIKELENQYGQDTIDQLVIEAIVKEEARKQNVEVTAQEIEDRQKSIITTFESEEAYDSALGERAWTRETHKEIIKVQLYLEKIIGAGAIPTEDEVKKFYDEYKDEEDYKGKKFEEVKDSIKQLLIDTDVDTRSREWLNDKYSKYNQTNNLTNPDNKGYQFLKSVSLINAVFGN